MQINEPLVTAPEFAKKLHVSVPTFWRRVADGTIPKPIKIGNLSRWPASDYSQVIAAASAARGEVPA